MNKELTDSDIKKAIKNCKWKKNFGGIDVCVGVCNVCVKTIEDGKCDTLQRLFQNGGTDE